MYEESHGKLPTEQVLKTFAVLLSNILRPPDWACHGEDNQFFILTHPDKAEKIASILCRQFDTVMPNFYSPDDLKRGYMMAIEDQVSRRVPLLTVKLGIVHSNVSAYKSHMGSVTASLQMMKLAKKHQTGSHWISDRLKLTGQSEAPRAPRAFKALVIETDAAMAFLLQSTLEMQGVEVEAVSNSQEAMAQIDHYEPQIVIMDAMIQGEESGWELAKALKERRPEIRLIFTSTIHNREKAMESGADLYFPKPFEFFPLLSWVQRVKEELSD